MCLRDLPSQRQPDARAVWFGRKEGHEQIGRLGEARAVVFHLYLQKVLGFRPPDPDATLRLERRVGGVLHEIVQQLIQLVAVRPNRQVGWSGRYFDGKPRLERFRTVDVLLEQSSQTLRDREVYDARRLAGQAPGQARDQPLW